MTQRNIHYELTKQRTSQSMGSRGTLSSYRLLDDFLRQHSNDLVYTKASLQYFVWVDDKSGIESANTIERKLFSDFGAQSKQSKGFSLFGRRDHYKEIFNWNLDGSIEQHLAYIDELGPLRELKPRPPLTIVVSADFWLKDTDKAKNMRSQVIAWLSPTSNTLALTLNFPHAQVDADFRGYKESLQIDCPVSLDDKFFYIRKAKSPDGYTFRKAF